MSTITLTLNPHDRLTLTTTIERLINLLDALDPDPDLEEEVDNDLSDWEPDSDTEPNGDELDTSFSEDEPVGYWHAGASGNAAKQVDPDFDRRIALLVDRKEAQAVTGARP